MGVFQVKLNWKQLKIIAPGLAHGESEAVLQGSTTSAQHWG